MSVNLLLVLLVVMFLGKCNEYTCGLHTIVSVKSLQ